MLTVFLKPPGGDPQPLDVPQCTGEELYNLASGELSMPVESFTLLVEGEVVQQGEEEVPLYGGEVLGVRVSKKAASRDVLVREYGYGEVEDIAGELLELFSTEEAWGDDKMKLITLLCDAGCDPDYANTPQLTTVAHVAAEYDFINPLKAMFTSGYPPANPCAVDCDAYTPLHIAASFGSLEVFNLLLTLPNIDPAQCTAKGTPLIAAATQGEILIAEKLLSLNVDVGINMGDVNGETALGKAVKMKHFDVMRLLLDYGADPSAQDMHGVGALHLACQCENEDAVIPLVSGGADVNLATLDRQTPLHYAVRSNHEEIVRNLLLLGASPTPPDADRWTPLHYAARRGFDSLCAILLEEGADPLQPDARGETPFDHAKLKHHDHVIRLFRDHVALS